VCSSDLAAATGACRRPAQGHCANPRIARQSSRSGNSSLGGDSAHTSFGGEGSFRIGLREAFLARAQPIKVPCGRTVISEGSDACDVYLICKGKVQISLFSPHGREVILRELGADRVFGELAAIDRQPRSADVIALEDSVLARMSGEVFLDFLGTVPQAGLWMSHVLAARVRDLTARAFELATMPVAGRVQSELLRLAREAGVEGGLTIDRMPTHAQLAARIGTHREAVTRELNTLTDEGILRRSGRKAEILSLPRLQSLYDRFRG